jgi:signal transduction histidine kinase
MSVWIILFAFGIRKEVKYIQQISCSVTQIELGSLNSEIPVKGMDELGTLAHGLDQMRIALIAKEENEKQMKSAQDKLVLGMAHDLRTPLTGLMTFLEIARKQQTLKECIYYIDKAYIKTTQIRDLSNQLFEFFLISSEQPMKLEEPENLEYALGEYLSELCGLLEMDGYQVLIDHLYWEPVQIQICIDYAGRIIDNLVSNIKKYADQTVPVELSSEYNASYASITIRNKSAKANQYVHGTGIGVKNIRAMMAQMNGICHICIEPDYYSMTLSFPIQKTGMATESKY